MSKLREEISDVETGPTTPRPRGSRIWWASLGGIVVVLVVAMLAVLLPRRIRSDSGQRQVSQSGLTASISIEPFATPDSVLVSWNATAFAEALATQLANVRWLRARVAGTGPTADFTLRGDVARRDGRLVITARLARSGDAISTVWSATYWRGDNPGVTLAEDIAAGVAEAVASELVRLDLTAKSRP
jgi:TolB-like protein